MGVSESRIENLEKKMGKEQFKQKILWILNFLKFDSARKIKEFLKEYSFTKIEIEEILKKWLENKGKRLKKGRKSNKKETKNKELQEESKEHY